MTHDTELQISPNFTMTIDAENATFWSGSDSVVFSGAAATVLIPWLVDRLAVPRTKEDLLAGLDPYHSDALSNALDLLASNDIVTSAHTVSVLAHSASSHYSETALSTSTSAPGLDPDGTAQMITAMHVQVAGSGRAADQLAEILEDSDVAVERSSIESLLTAGATEITSANKVVVFAGSGVEQGEVDSLDRLMNESGQPWLPITPFDGERMTVGPFIVPGESACHHCYIVRRSAASVFGATWAQYLTASKPMGESPSMSSLAAAVAATCVIRWATVRDRRLPGTVLQLRPWESTTTEHFVRRVPRCAVCGPQYASYSPWTQFPW